MTRSFAISGDLGDRAVLVACVLAGLSLVLLVAELIRAPSGPKGGRMSARLAIAASGAVAVGTLLAAVLRPVTVASREIRVGPPVVVLVDGSRSMDLPAAGGVTRRELAARALDALASRREELRASVRVFGEGEPRDLEGSPADALRAARPASQSDLVAALEAVRNAREERPAAIVVISDGRLDRPGESGAEAETRAALGALEVPVHTIDVGRDALPDASIRSVRAAGTVVAHQKTNLRVEVGCEGLSCDSIDVTARELREVGTPTTLSTGTVKVSGKTGTVELGMTLDRAGTRILEIAIGVPEGDAVPDNNRRFVALDVARERVRVLHVAGRPTYDVRALRTWLKADASVDVVAFFILRTQSDEVVAAPSELALIPFPVDELFQEHLSSFDAVVLQDFDALPYGLSKYMGELERYVDKGGGLVLVGGPDSFGPGHYAGTALAKALPVELGDEIGAGVDLGAFRPRMTEVGRVAPVLAPLRAVLGDELPEVPGTNIVGDARPGAIVLFEHPTRKTSSGAPMPVLALGEHGSGRTIALTIDGSHRLLFSAFAASAAGRAHGAFWDAMLGWLMRDPRFEPAFVEVRDGCIAGEDTTLVLRPLPGEQGDAKVVVRRLGSSQPVREATVMLAKDAGPTPVSIGKLDAGGYSATVEIAKGPSTRRDFACEKGGDEWADTRPDPERLAAVANATKGAHLAPADAASIPLPPSTLVAAERQVAPILPPWAWTLAAALTMGAHWIVRRRAGLV